MTKSQLLLLSEEELLKVLNEDHQQNPKSILDLFEIESYEGICAECSGQTHQKRAGDEGWTYCEGCQSVEGKTYEIDAVPALKVGFNYTLNKWQAVSESLGEEM